MVYDGRVVTNQSLHSQLLIIILWYMTYSCIIADDSAIERDKLEIYLRKIERLHIVAVCSDGMEVSNLLSKQSVDIIFSDIDMPELSGIGLLKSLKRPPVFIFFTGHSEYAVESFELDVIDFLVKPVTFERVVKAANKAIDYLDLKRHNITTQENATDDTDVQLDIADDYFFIKDTPGLIKVKFDEVVYLESMGNFSSIHTLKGKKHMALAALKKFESSLPVSIFSRTHKQYIVNHHHIVSISTQDVVLEGGHTIPVSLSHRQALLDKVVNKKLITRFQDNE